MTEPNLALLSQMWEKYMQAPFPPTMGRRVIEGEDMLLLDTETAGCLVSTLSGRLDERLHAILLDCLEAIEKVLPHIEDEDTDASSYYRQLRDMAALAAETTATS
ncbi:hypothetical protein ACFXKW_36345 [Streptomyces sp. NPDC059193]|uniref:hypothetical protein n=1 Tax=Streptomyces sp. NPDC059193 TaxID=3346763 RepID=UPI0036B2C0C4